MHRLLRAAAGELQDENALSLQLIAAMANDSNKPLSNAGVDKARKQHRQRNNEHSRQLQSVATRLGIPDPTQARWVVGYAEIVREATAAAGTKGYYGEAMWRMISGLTHPSLMRATTRSNVEEIGDNEDGTIHALVTTDIGLTRTAFEASLLNATAAVNKIGERKLRRGDPADYSRPGDIS